MVRNLNLLFFFYSSRKDMLTDLRERGDRSWVGGRDRESERAIRCPHRNQTCTCGACPGWGSNLQSSGVRDGAPTNWATRPEWQTVPFKSRCLHLVILMIISVYHMLYSLFYVLINCNKLHLMWWFNVFYFWTCGKIYIKFTTLTIF